MNDDAVKFCTNCGNPLAPPVVGPGTTLPPSQGRVSPAAPPGPKSAFRIFTIAAVVIIVILSALSVLQVSGIVTVFPFLTPAVTPRVTPIATSSVTTDTPLPETTPVMVITTAVTNLRESPVASPPPTKVIICPSDRRACGANCTDILTDPGNCGNCGVSCNSGQVCQNGHCMTKCPVGEVTCFGGCYNLSYDAQNCGACGNSCPVGLACNKSVCAPTLPTTIPTYAG